MSQSDTTAGGTAPSLPPLARLRAILGGSAGNLVEWYDWSTYLFLSLYFAKQFFPEGDQTAQLLKAAAVSLVGFLARPLGAWLMGLYADRAGRRAALTLSISLMCLGSLIIAFAPTYAMVGGIAPIVLLGARLLQGLSVGGEYGASATYMSEVAGRKHRGFWSSFQYVTLIAGSLTAQLVLIILQATLSKPDLDAWGWRIPFVIGALLAVIVFWIRRRLDESHSFKISTEARMKVSPLQGWSVGLLVVAMLASAGFGFGTKGALADEAQIGAIVLFFALLAVLIAPTLKAHPKATLAVMGLTAAGSLGYYVYTSYMQKFLVNTSGFSKDQATMISAAALFCFMLAQPLFGWLSDRIGRKPMLLIAFAGGAIVTWPILSTMAVTHDPMTAFLLLLGALLFQSCYSSISAVVKAELYPTHIRALGVALPYAVANSVFGGSAEYVALAFKQNHHESGFYIYVTVVMILGLAVSLMMRDTQKHSAILED
ncbi:MHS family alpha-ketoglutarate permease-like MFS transporter [Caulobacter ginsengisoli]|uniref:MHS family alpha-ketoglutarate permease-like MFS transporter n=1 Tax=Caulobacter ginsengisoli TaxID=400775 RepID=A0ABU0IQZ6_9CAUL|nr:MFS transporter [Caulobacter ginsengisoli]MDQ0464437.1 MHS family alpha-ketoglutarate permease-like MFS transporter [Caulobacter ginsengisoli]